MPESQQPASAGHQGLVPMNPNTVTEPLLAEALPSPSPKRRRAPAKRKPRSKAKAADAQRAVHFSASKPQPTDLYDRVEQRIRNSGAYMRDNVMNAVVASGVVLLIVLAHWATQQEISTAAVSAAVTPSAEVAPAPLPASATQPDASNPAVSPTETITATAVVEDPASPLPAEPSVADAPPAVATTTANTEMPVVDTPSPPVIPTGTVIETSVSIRAPLDPTKTPPVIEPVVEAAPQAQIPVPVVRRAPAVRRRVRVTAAQAPALLNDPYTNGGATDLDAPTVRQQYLQQNQTMKSLSASRTE